MRIYLFEPVEDSALTEAEEAGLKVTVAVAAGEIGPVSFAYERGGLEMNDYL